MKESQQESYIKSSGLGKKSDRRTISESKHTDSLTIRRLQKQEAMYCRTNKGLVKSSASKLGLEL
jgi:hypothetical protein